MSEQQTKNASNEAAPPPPPPEAAPNNGLAVSEKAAAQIKLIQERESKYDSMLRVSVVGGGCSGLSYKLSFDEAAKEKDRIVEAFGVKLLVDSKSALFLKGTILDFTDGLNGQGFVFTNPNAKSSCGCGSSFSA